MGLISKKIDSLIDAMNECRKELRLKNDFIKMDRLPHDEDGKKYTPAHTFLQDPSVFLHIRQVGMYHT